MTTFNDTDPKQFIADFLNSYSEEFIYGDEDPSVVVDRYHTPDIVEIADGIRMDRDKLIAHAKPLRKNRPSGRMEVHDAIAHGDQIAARYTMYVHQRGKDLTIEVYFFGRFAADGRMRESHQLTRTVTPPPQPTAPT